MFGAILINGCIFPEGSLFVLIFWPHMCILLLSIKADDFINYMLFQEQRRNEVTTTATTATPPPTE